MLIAVHGKEFSLSASSTFDLTVFCDADWETCSMTRKSISGYCLNLGQSLISWKVKWQTTMARSAAEAKYPSMGSPVAEIIWIIGLLAKLSLTETTCA